MTSSPAPDLKELAARLRRLHSPSRTVRAICGECGETRPCGVELLAEAARSAAGPDVVALREKVEALRQWWAFDDTTLVSRAAVLALLATPPAPSDHGALDVERLARAMCLVGTDHYRGWDYATVGEHAHMGLSDPTHREEAADLAAAYLAAPSVPPEEPRP